VYGKAEVVRDGEDAEPMVPRYSEDREKDILYFI
jgi:hypothetical protein